MRVRVSLVKAESVPCPTAVSLVHFKCASFLLSFPVFVPEIGARTVFSERPGREDWLRLLGIVFWNRGTSKVAFGAASVGGSSAFQLASAVKCDT